MSTTIKRSVHRLAWLGVVTLSLAGAAHAATWQLAPGDAIQPAIDRAAAGDTITLARGHYRGNLRIDKPLTLRGIDRPTLDAEGVGDVIRIAAPDVTVEGLILKNSGDKLGGQNSGVFIQAGADRAVLRNCDLAYNLFGAYIEGVKDVTIEGNLITGKRDYASASRGNGIQLYNTTGAKITRNHISFVRDGIYVDISHHAVFDGNRIHHVRYGTHYMNSHHNRWENNESFHNRGGLAIMMARDQIVRNNRAWGNSDHGIMLRTLQDSVIEGNIVAGNARGFFIYDAEFNVLRNNLVVDNTVGAHVWAGSKNNEVEGNDFISNREQVRHIAARDELWGVKEGNYWSNYLGWDRNGDGRGDVPYEANDLVDRLSWQHPMMKLLLASPAVQTLRLVGQQFPLLRAPSIVDPQPHMQPRHDNWSKWRDKYFPGPR